MKKFVASSLILPLLLNYVAYATPPLNRPTCKVSSATYTQQKTDESHLQMLWIMNETQGGDLPNITKIEVYNKLGNLRRTYNYDVVYRKRCTVNIAPGDKIVFYHDPTFRWRIAYNTNPYHVEDLEQSECCYCIVPDDVTIDQSAGTWINGLNWNNNPYGDGQYTWDCIYITNYHLSYHSSNTWPSRMHIYAGKGD